MGHRLHLGFNKYANWEHLGTGLSHDGEGPGNASTPSTFQALYATISQRHRNYHSNAVFLNSPEWALLLRVEQAVLIQHTPLLLTLGQLWR